MEKSGQVLGKIETAKKMVIITGEPNPEYQDNPKASKLGDTHVEIPEPLRMGILYDATKREDVLHYADCLAEFNNLSPDNEIIIFGIKEDEKLFENVKYLCINPVSIIHWFKTIAKNKIDLLFVPLIDSVFNRTSETIIKYLEFGINSVPLFAPAWYPYSDVITDKQNGFLYKEKEDILPYFKYFMIKKQFIKAVGATAYQNIIINKNIVTYNIYQCPKCNLIYKIPTLFLPIMATPKMKPILDFLSKCSNCNNDLMLVRENLNSNIVENETWTKNFYLIHNQ